MPSSTFALSEALHSAHSALTEGWNPIQKLAEPLQATEEALPPRIGEKTVNKRHGPRMESAPGAGENSAST